MSQLLRMALLLAVAGGGLAAVNGCHDDRRGRDHVYAAPADRDHKHYRHDRRYDHGRYYDGDRHDGHREYYGYGGHREHYDRD